MNANNYKNISIIIPTLNEEKHIAQCIKSLIDLDYPKECVEILVIDNGSIDKTIQIADSYGVDTFKEESLNIAGLRNFGVGKARGEIIAFVDADCIVLKDWIDRASNYFDDQSVVAWGSPAIIPQNSTWVQNTWFLVRQKVNEIQEVDWLESMNLFVKKNKFLEIGGFNEALTTCEDVDFSYRIKKYGKIISDNRITVIHLGEAATIKEFIKKEIWRGQSNFKGIASHGLSIKEIPSLAIPIFFGIFLPLSFLTTVFYFNLFFPYIFSYY